MVSYVRLLVVLVFSRDVRGGRWEGGARRIGGFLGGVSVHLHLLATDVSTYGVAALLSSPPSIDGVKPKSTVQRQELRFARAWTTTTNSRFCDVPLQIEQHPSHREAALATTANMVQ